MKTTSRLVHSLLLHMFLFSGWKFVQMSPVSLLVPPSVLMLLFFVIFLQETRTLAEIAKAELDGTVMNNRPIRIRFPVHGAALTVRNLLPAVTNELLEQVNWSSHFPLIYEKHAPCFTWLLLWRPLSSGLFPVWTSWTGDCGDGWSRLSHREGVRGIRKQRCCPKSPGVLHRGSSAADHVRRSTHWNKVLVYVADWQTCL